MTLKALWCKIRAALTTSQVFPYPGGWQRGPFLPYDWAAETGEWTDIFRDNGQNLTAEQVQHMQDLPT